MIGMFLQVVMVVLGVAMIVRAIAGGGGPAAAGIVLGVMFIAVGAGRLWMERRAR